MTARTPFQKLTPSARSVRLGAMALFFAVVIAAAIMSRVTGRPYMAYLQTVLLSVLAGMLVRRLVRWMRYVRGRAMLDLGPNPMHRSLRLISVITFCAFLFFAVDMFTANDSLGSGIIGLATLVLVATSVFATALERFQLVEDGIWCFGDLKPWNGIAGYSWTPDSKVVLRMRGRANTFKGHAIAVPEEHRDAVETALISHGVVSFAP